MAATTTFINSTLDAAFTGTITMKLFRTGLPSTTGVELSGGGYAAQTLSLAAASGKTKSTSANAVFADLTTSQTIVAWGVYKAGTLIDEGTFTTPITPDTTTNNVEVSYTFDLTGV